MITYKCYPVDSGVMGNISRTTKDRYMLFASESDYREWIEAQEEDDD